MDKVFSAWTSSGCYCTRIGLSTYPASLVADMIPGGNRLREITDWINCETTFKTFEQKIEFFLGFEKWVRKWLAEKRIWSFHIKHKSSLLTIRARLMVEGDNHQSLARELRDNLASLCGVEVPCREIPKKEEDFTVHDSVTMKIDELITEILFVLVKEYGKDYPRHLCEKYLRIDKFDTIHLLLNQLGLDERDNVIVLNNVFAHHLNSLIVNYDALVKQLNKLKPRVAPSGDVDVA